MKTRAFPIVVALVILLILAKRRNGLHTSLPCLDLQKPSVEVVAR